MNSSPLAFEKLHLALIAGAAAVFVAVPSAQAGIVVVDRTATPINITNSIDGVYFNVVTGVSGASAATVPGWDINPYNNNAGLTFYGSAAPGGVLVGFIDAPPTASVATALSFGALISAAGAYNQFQTQGTNFQTAGTRYLGFKFLNEGTTVYNYGWLRVVSGALPLPNGGFPTLITAYGYENAGASITAGAGLVPEPATYLMFAAALAGALGRRALKAR